MVFVVLFELSATEVGGQTYQSTKQQDEVISKTDVSEMTTETITSRSRWSKILEALWSVTSFLIVTLPVGEFDAALLLFC